MWAVLNEHWYSAEPQISVSPWKAELGVDLLVWPSILGSSGWKYARICCEMGTGGRCDSLVMQPLSYLHEKHLYVAGKWKTAPLVFGVSSISWRRCQRLSSWLPPLLQLNLLFPLPWPHCQALGLRSNCWGSPSSCSWPGSLQTCEGMWTPIFSHFFHSKLGFMTAFTKK